MEIELPKSKHLTYIFLILFGIFLITKNLLIGMASVLAFIVSVVAEMKEGAKDKGWKEEVKDTVMSIVYVLIFWFALQFILRTETPISAIASCSMLPNLEKGDLIIVYGGEPENLPHEQISEADALALESPETDIYQNGKHIGKINGSLFSYCRFSKNEICERFDFKPDEFYEKKGAVEFKYSMCEMKIKTGNGERKVETPCVSGMSINGKNISIDKKRDVVVYRPRKESYFSLIGDIVHRGQAIVENEDEWYVLTKGDNNQVFDIQIYDPITKKWNVPPSRKEYLGRVIAKIPFIGYVKLLLFGLGAQNPQCFTLLGDPI